MAQELRTVDQQTPQIIEDGQRSVPRPRFLPPAEIYETATMSSCSPRCRVWLSMGLISLLSAGC